MNRGDMNFNERSFSFLKKQYLCRLKQWRNEQMDVLRQNRPLTDADQKKWFKCMQTDKSQAVFSILAEDRPKLQFIGYCGLTNIDYVNRRGEISFLLDPLRVKEKALYRADFISALYVLCRYGFEKLNLHKIYAETYIFRGWHIKILDEFGLKRGGKLREHKFIGDKFWDSVIHSVLKNEWTKIKKRINNEVAK